MYGLFRPTPALQINLQAPTIESEEITSNTVKVNRGAVGFIDADGRTMNCRALGLDNSNPKYPTASLAKVITALVVLDAKPIKDNSTDTVTITDQDMADHWNNISDGGSFAPIILGEKLTERQLLEGVMLASANNMANIVAKWVFGSMDGYHQAAAKWLKQHGLNNTTVGVDASGFNPSTQSTPLDLCKIMLLAAQNPTLVSIMEQHEVILPTGDKITNTNRLLGQNGIYAGKTGYTEEAGFGLLLLSKQKVGDQNVIMATVSLGNNSYDQAFQTAEQLLVNSSTDIRVNRINANSYIGSIGSMWGQASSLVTTKPLYNYYWADQPPEISIIMNDRNLDNLPVGSPVGQIKIGESSVNLVTDSAIDPPSTMWRLMHPL